MLFCIHVPIYYHILVTNEWLWANARIVVLSSILCWAVIGWWQHLRMAFFRCHASLVHHWLFKHRNRHMIFLTACHNSLSLLICSHLLNLHEIIEKAWETGPGTVSRYFISAMVRELTEHWDWFTACGKRQPPGLENEDNKRCQKVQFLEWPHEAGSKCGSFEKPDGNLLFPCSWWGVSFYITLSLKL